MRRLFVVGVAICFSSTALAVTQEAAFKEGLKFADANQSMPVTKLKEFKPKEVIKDYTDHPEEIAYKESPDSLKAIAKEKVQKDVYGKAMLDTTDARNEKFHYSKDPNAPVIQNAMQRADAIYDVVTSQYGACTKKTDCTTTYQTESCVEAPLSSLHFCKQTLNVEMVPKQYDTHYKLVAKLSVSDKNYAGVTVNTSTGKIHFLGPKKANFTLEGRIPADVDCKLLHGKVIDQQGDGFLDTLNLPSCENGLMLNMHFEPGHEKVLTIDMVSSKIVLEPKDHWQDECEGLSGMKNCAITQERCLEENTTHIIDGIPVARACWQKENSYRCGAENQLRLCEPLRQKGCEQVASTCKNNENGTCSLYEQTFRCPTKECTDVGMICNGETYCLDGDCVKQQKKADPDFQRGVSALSAAKEAGSSFADFKSIFAGEHKTCNKVFLGFIDCCKDEGWGADIHLAKCSPEEKDLREKKEERKTVYLGEYCNKDVLGQCIEKHKAYCVFPSKIARIIQEQGRRDQLGISFGDPEHANCKGLTREQFAQLNLEKMDFSDFYEDIAKKQKVENGGQLSQRIDENAHHPKQEVD